METKEELKTENKTTTTELTDDQLEAVAGGKPNSDGALNGDRNAFNNKANEFNEQMKKLIEEHMK